MMKIAGRKASLLVCLGLLALSSTLLAQQPAPATPVPAAPPVQTPPPRTAAPAPAPAASSDDEPSDNPFSLMLSYWVAPTHPEMRGGRNLPTGSNSHNLDFTGTNKGTPGVEITLPGGQYNVIRASYFRSWATTNTKTTQAQTFFGTTYDSGSALRSKYTIQNAKFSWDYLSSPFPPAGAKFRLKTLWGAEFVTMHTNLSAPVKASDGTVFSNDASGSNWMILPTLGLGIEYRASRNFWVEMRGEGFWLPHRTNIGDAEASLNVKIGKVEIALGGRYLHFRTSPNKEQFNQANMPGGFIGFRYRPE